MKFTRSSYESAQALWDQLLSNINVISAEDLEAARELLFDATGWTRDQLVDHWHSLQNYNK